MENKEKNEAMDFVDSCVNFILNVCILIVAVVKFIVDNPKHWYYYKLYSKH